MIIERIGQINNNKKYKTIELYFLDPLGATVTDE
jgi:hypothetical protein